MCMHTMLGIEVMKDFSFFPKQETIIFNEVSNILVNCRRTAPLTEFQGLGTSLPSIVNVRK